MSNQPTKRVAIVSVSLVKESSLLYQNRRVTSPEDCFEILNPFLENKDREHLIVLGLNAKHEPTVIHTAHIGAINQSLASPREIMKVLLLSNSVYYKSNDLQYIIS